MSRIAVAVVSVGLIAVAVVIASAGFTEPAPAVDAAGAQKLAALQGERRDILREAVEGAEMLFRNARVEYSTVHRLSIELLNAELDLAPDRAARIAVRERILKQRQAMEEIVVAQKEAARTAEVTVLEAKADRLQAEIDLLREKADEK
jgi:hypothetical protein